VYKKLPNLILGFHGCHEDVHRAVVVQGESLKASDNSYDWLGNGIYFWEQNYERAYEWAKNRYGSKAAVIGAVIDLGYCLNLTDSASADVLRQGFELLQFRCGLLGNNLPQNRKSKKAKDVLLRDLDCAVIQQIHEFNNETNNQRFDSVRGIFTEGEPVYPGSEILEKTHVQICVCNPNCIKGYFSPLEKNDKYPLP
jgi:hypothetical protein